LLGENAFSKARETHYARICFIAGCSKFLEVQKSFYS
jgi:hypothetical protein